MKLVKFIIGLLLLVPFLSTAQDTEYEKEYERGIFSCSEADVKSLLNQDSENIDWQYLYFSCKVIQGYDRFLNDIYDLADNHSHLLSKDFISHYEQTDGGLDGYPKTDTRVDEAIKYREQTLATIKLIPNYPKNSWFYDELERDYQIELNSNHTLPYLYFYRYNLGLIGDYEFHRINSPSYKKGKYVETFDKYNKSMYYSLENVVKYAEQCMNLPYKQHFDKKLYDNTKKACGLMWEVALKIELLEKERKDLLSECNDLNKEGNCPEYYKIQKKIDDLMFNTNEKYISLVD